MAEAAGPDLAQLIRESLDELKAVTAGGAAATRTAVATGSAIAE